MAVQAQTLAYFTTTMPVIIGKNHMSFFAISDLNMNELKALGQLLVNAK